jgi:hypothetical protein
MRLNIPIYQYTTTTTTMMLQWGWTYPIWKAENDGKLPIGLEEKQLSTSRVSMRPTSILREMSENWCQ